MLAASRDDEVARVAAAVRIRIGRVGDVDAELLVIAELAQVAEDADVAVVEAVAAAHDGAAGAEDVPRHAGARTEVVRDRRAG